MKVCLIFASKGRKAGIEQHVIDLYKNLIKKNIDVYIVANDEYKQYFENNFIRFNFLSRYNIINHYKLLKLLKKYNFNIIHTHGNKATDIVVKIKPFLDGKIVSTIHSQKKKTKSYNKANCVIGVSYRVLQNINNKCKTVIYNGIKIKPKNLQKFTKFTIIFVGRLEKVKQVDDLIIKLKKVNFKGKLLIIGDGSEKQKLINIANNVNFDVEFTGFIEREKVFELIEKSHLMIINSIKEGFSYVFVESLFLNTPVLSTDVADIKNFIHKWIYQDFKDFCKKFNHIYNNYEKFYKDYQKNINYAKQEFSLEIMVKKTIDIYKKVAK